MNKICTSIEQSKKLLELGIAMHTADMVYQFIENEYGSGKWESIPRNNSLNIGYDDDIPCWSLAALLRLIPNFNMFKRTIECRIETTNHLIDKACDPIDAAFEMVSWLLKNNKI